MSHSYHLPSKLLRHRRFVKLLSEAQNNHDHLDQSALRKVRLEGIKFVAEFSPETIERFGIKP